VVSEVLRQVTLSFTLAVREDNYISCMFILVCADGRNCTMWVYMDMIAQYVSQLCVARLHSLTGLRGDNVELVPKNDLLTSYLW
jgi:hypothetical protein